MPITAKYRKQKHADAILFARELIENAHYRDECKAFWVNDKETKELLQYSTQGDVKSARAMYLNDETVLFYITVDFTKENNHRFIFAFDAKDFYRCFKEFSERNKNRFVTINSAVGLHKDYRTNPNQDLFLTARNLLENYNEDSDYRIVDVEKVKEFIDGSDPIGMLYAFAMYDDGITTFRCSLCKGTRKYLDVMIEKEGKWRVGE